MKTSEHKLMDVDPRRRTKIKATAALVEKGRGILKRGLIKQNQGDKSLSEDWAEHRKLERALEERRIR